MPNLYNLTADLGDLLGGDAIAATARGRVEVNLPRTDALIDTGTGGQIRLGNAPVTINADGTLLVEGLVGSDSTDLNIEPGTLQYQLTIEYRDPAIQGRGADRTYRSGWFFLNATSDVATVAKTVTPAVAASGADIIAAASFEADRAEAAAELATAPTDTQMETLVNDPASLTSGALSATYGLITPPATPSRNYAVQDYTHSTGQPVATFTSTAGWSADVGTMTADGDGIKVAASTVGGIGRINRDISVNFGGEAPTLRLEVTPHDHNIASIQIHIASTGFATDYIWHTSDFAPYGVGERRTIAVPLDDWVITGTESWANTMKAIRVRVNSKPDTTTAGVTLHGDMTWGHVIEPRVVFSFDDGVTSVYENAYPIMRARGIPGVVYLNSSTIGTPGYMTVDQLTEMYKAGWDIASHGHAHLNYTGMAVADIQADMEAARDWLRSNGFARSADHFATPNTVYTPEVRQAAKNAGIKTVRLGQTAHTDPAADVLAMTSLYVLDTTSLDTVKGWLDQTWDGKGTAILLMHTVNATSQGTYDWLASDFTALVDYIHDQVQESSVVTMSRWWRGRNADQSAQSFALAGKAALGEGSHYGSVLTGGGVCTLADRRSASATTPPSGTVVLSYFRAPTSLTASQVRTGSSTAAGATPTLCRIGLYEVGANGDLTLIGATANDTTLFNAASVAYSRALTTPAPVVQGRWYAVGHLIVSAAAMPSIIGAAAQGYSNLVLGSSPRLSGARAGQTDLPASITAGNVATSNQFLWAEVLP